MSNHGEDTILEEGEVVEAGEVEQTLLPQPPLSPFSPVICFMSSSLDTSTTPQHPGLSPALSVPDKATMNDQWFQEPEVRRYPYRLVWGFNDDGEEIIVWAMQDGRYLTDEELQEEQPSFVDTVQYQCPCLGHYPYLPCIHCRKPTFEGAVPPMVLQFCYCSCPTWTTWGFFYINRCTQCQNQWLKQVSDLKKGLNNQTLVDRAERPVDSKMMQSGTREYKITRWGK